VGGVAREGVDDLLEPVLAKHRPPESLPRPWRLGSQVYVALLGGPLALAAIGTINARLLRMPAVSQAAIAGIGIVAEIVLVVLARSLDLSSEARIASAVAGVLAYGAAYLIQRSADRVYRYHAHDEEPYASMVAVGLIAVVAARVIELALWWPK
jgi:hypothetical protein